MILLLLALVLAYTRRGTVASVASWTVTPSTAPTDERSASSGSTAPSSSQGEYGTRCARRPPGPDAAGPIGSTRGRRGAAGPLGTHARLGVVGNRLVNEAMVRGGWAVLYTVPPNVKYAGRLERAQKDGARGAGRTVGKRRVRVPAERLPPERVRSDLRARPADEQQVGDVVEGEEADQPPARVHHGKGREPARPEPLERLVEARGWAERSGRSAVIDSATPEPAPRWLSPRMRLSRVRMPSVRPRLSTTGNSRCSPVSSSSTASPRVA